METRPKQKDTSSRKYPIDRKVYLASDLDIGHNSGPFPVFYFGKLGKVAIFKTLFKPNNRPDEVNSKVVIAYDLVNKCNMLVGSQTSKPN